jgi:Zn-dependent protease with chaperone function
MRGLWNGAAAGFVVGYTAVRLRTAWLDRASPFSTVTAPDPQAYGAARRGLMVAGIVRSTASMAMTAFIVAPPVERALRRLPRALRAAAFVAFLTGLDGLRDLAVDYVEGHVMERTYGTSDQTAAAWGADHVKAAGVGLGITMIVAGLGDAVVRKAPRRWPWIAIAATPVLLTLANVVAPTYILPLFNTYAPLEGTLERRIRELAARYGAGDAAILRFDMSRQTKKANAFVTGVFGTQRIVLADTLIGNFAEDETLFVVAHELGHYVRRDPWLSIGVGTLFAAATIGVGNLALRRAGRPLETLTDGARFAFYASLCSTLGGPLMAAISRAVERRADAFAIEATRDPRSGARAFRRLRDQNLAEDEQPKWAELLFSTHPSLKSRIAHLETAISH